MKTLNINLQLFAIQTTLTPGLSVENKTFYDMELLRNAAPLLVHQQFGQKRNIPKNGGKTIEFRRYGALAKNTTPLTEGVVPAGSDMTVTALTAEVKQYGDYITLSDFLDLTAIDNNVLEATKLLSDQAGRTLDTIVRNVLHSGTNVTFCPKLADDGTTTEVKSRGDLDNTCALTLEVILEVVAKLRAANARTINGAFVGIIHPHVIHDLMVAGGNNFIEISKYANPEKIYAGEIGTLGGVRWVATSEAKIYEGGVYGTLVFGEGAYGVTEISGGGGLETFIKQLGSAGSADPINQKSSVGWKAALTAAILNGDHLVRIESKSAKFSATVATN